MRLLRRKEDGWYILQTKTAHFDGPYKTKQEAQRILNEEPAKATQRRMKGRHAEQATH